MGTCSFCAPDWDALTDPHSFHFVTGPSEVSPYRPGLKSGKSQAAGRAICPSSLGCTLQPDL